MRIQHNISAMNANRNLSRNRTSLGKNLEKLSSGYRINRSADDAAGLAISEKMRAKIAEIDECINNVSHGINLVQTADAALVEVNDMIHRAEELCIKAANDTYSEEERQAMTNEVNAIYDEMERIFETAQFNTIQLFKQQGSRIAGCGGATYEYNETVTTGQIEEWGDISSLTVQQTFDLAADAEQATLTFKLDSDVDVNDASTLNGKSFEMKSPNYSPVRITFSSLPTEYTGYKGTTRLDDGTTCYLYTINVNSCSTVEDAFNLLCQESQNNSRFTNQNLELDAEKTVVKSDGTITIAFDLDPLVQTINGSSYKTEDANGANANGNVISGIEEAMLDQVDSTDNETAYSETASYSVEFLAGLSGTLTADQITAFTSNTLTVGGNTISFSSYTNVTTAEEARNAIVTEINNLSEFTAELDGTKVKVTREKEQDDTDDVSTSCCTTYITENYKNGIQKTSSAPSITTVTTPATNEAPGSCTIDISASDLPISVVINGRTYTYCLQESGQAVYGATSVTSITDAYQRIAWAIANQYPDTTTQVSGSTITVTGKYAAQNVDISISGTSETFTVYQRLFFPNGGGNYLETSCSIPLNLGESLPDPTQTSVLNGTGFTINIGSSAYTFEFNDGTADMKNSDATKIDISNCTGYDDIAQQIEDAINDEMATVIQYSLQNSGKDAADIVRVTVGADANGNLSINFPTRYTSITLTDGLNADSLFDSETTDVVSETAENGSNATQPQTVLDFSSYNTREEIEQLYGTGFRVTCATCEGEFINVVFCHDLAQTEIPESFEYTDPSTGATNTIRNFVVQLKDANNGTDIVKGIVNQLTGQLDHYTDVAVGKPASKLIVMDKRAGNLLDTDGNIARAEVLNGVYTNFGYTVDITVTPNAESYIGDPASGVTAYFGSCLIFAGEEDGKGFFIPVHLPNLSLEQLNLDPPRPDLTDTTSIDDLLNRLQTADSVIVTARAQMGADQNRLEHTSKNLGVMYESFSASESQIRDTDIAAEMMAYTKNNILIQAAQAMLSQANQTPQGVLQLMR